MRKQTIELLRRLHYRLMDNPRYWYLPELKDADRMVCVAASDLRAGKFSMRAPWKRLRFSHVRTIAGELLATGAAARCDEA